MMASLRGSIKVFVDGDEFDGFTLYEIAGVSGDLTHDISLPLGMAALSGSSVLSGVGWAVRLQDIVIREWPGSEASWIISLETLLRDAVLNGAVASWISCEGLPYVDPPNLFDPQLMAGGILAYAVNGVISAVPAMSETIRPIDALSMETLRKLTAGYSDRD